MSEFDPDDPVLELIRCPVTHDPFRVASGRELAAINQRVAAGKVLNRSGQVVTQPLDAALVNRSGTLIAPVFGGIITLLADEMIPADSLQDILNPTEQGEGTT